MLIELATWIGVGVVSLVAWALYALGEQAPRNQVQSEESTRED